MAARRRKALRLKKKRHLLWAPKFAVADSVVAAVDEDVGE